MHTGPWRTLPELSSANPEEAPALLNEAEGGDSWHLGPENELRRTVAGGVTDQTSDSVRMRRARDLPRPPDATAEMWRRRGESVTSGLSAAGRIARRVGGGTRQSRRRELGRGWGAAAGTLQGAEAPADNSWLAGLEDVREARRRGGRAPDTRSRRRRPPTQRESTRVSGEGASAVDTSPGGSEQQPNQKEEQLCSMGFPLDQVRSALRGADDDVRAALNSLLQAGGGTGEGASAAGSSERPPHRPPRLPRRHGQPVERLPAARRRVEPPLAVATFIPYAEVVSRGPRDLCPSGVVAELDEHTTADEVETLFQHDPGRVISGIRSPSLSVRLVVLEALLELALNPDNQVKIAEAGDIPPLVNLVGDLCASSEEREFAAEVLAYLARNAENKVSIASAGVIDLLVALVRDGGTAGERQYAAAALGNLAHNNADNQVKIASADGIPPLVALARDGGTVGERKFATGALGVLAFSNAANQVAIASAGGIPPLVALARDGGTTGEREEAAAALAMLAANNANNQVEITSAGGIPPLVKMVCDGGTAEEREAAAWALAMLARTAPVTIASAGGIPPLVKMVRDGGTARGREAAARALSNLAVNADNLVTIASAGGIDPLVKMVRDGGTAGEREHAARALKELAKNSQNRRAINAAGGIPGEGGCVVQ